MIINPILINASLSSGSALGQDFPGSMAVHLAHTKHWLKTTEAIKGNSLHIWTCQNRSVGAASPSFFLPLTYEPIVKCIVAASSLWEIFGPPQDIKSFLFLF